MPASHRFTAYCRGCDRFWQNDEIRCSREHPASQPCCCVQPCPDCDGIVDGHRELQVALGELQDQIEDAQTAAHKAAPRRREP